MHEAPRAPFAPEREAAVTPDPKGRFRLAVVNSHPIQYFAPLYAYLNRDPRLDVTALYASDFSVRGAVDPGFGRSVSWDVDLLSGYRAVFLGGRAHRRTPGGFWSLVCPEVWREVRSGGYDAVLLHGYVHAVNVLAWLAAWSRGIPVLMRSETHLGLQRVRWRRRLRDWGLSMAYRRADGFLAIGSANLSYYRSLGIPTNRIFNVPYTVDNDRFMAAAALSPAVRAGVRETYGLPADVPVVLYASKLTRRKHPDVLVRAMAAVRARGVRAALFVVGTGELEAEVCELAASLGLTDVIFGGFVNQRELPRVYAAADVFVLPSENEPWGLIVNEVMCAGLPVVVSAEVGCVPDLVRDGVNGIRVKARDVEGLASALERLLTDESLRARMGRASLKIIEGWSYAQCRDGVLSALEACVPRVGKGRP